MSIQALNWALNQDQISNSATRFVLLVLCNYADENGQCYPSRETIAKKTSLSVRSVQTHLNWLSENGFLTWKNQRMGSRQSVNVYQLQGEGFAPSGGVRVQMMTSQSANDGNSQGEPFAQYPKEENHHKNHIEIFEFWKATMSLNGSTKLTPKRKRNIQARLRDGYDIEQIQNAIRGCAISPFHSGQNETKTVYNDIELICRSGEKVEFFERIWRDSRPKEKSEEQVAHPATLPLDVQDGVANNQRADS